MGKDFSLAATLSASCRMGAVLLGRNSWLTYVEAPLLNFFRTLFLACIAFETRFPSSAPSHISKSTS